VDTNDDLLLELLNSSPVINGAPTDALTGGAGNTFADQFGGTGTTAETVNLRQMRDILQRLIRGADATRELNAALESAALTPEATPQGLRWNLRTDPDRQLATRAATAWSRILEEHPGRLRACANEECNLFLFDRSRPGTAKWCSMATCGNRMKARTFAQRH